VATVLCGSNLAPADRGLLLGDGAAPQAASSVG